jgi:hypothetical protein
MDQGTMSCSPYSCSAGACTATCNVDADCMGGGTYCSGTGGTCLPKKAQGATCSGVNQCSSGFCVDTVCCNNACNNACQACSAAKKQTGLDGTCDNAKDAQADPRGMCATQPASSCGTDGKCSGGLCEQYGTSTGCSSSVCTTTTQQTSYTTCDGAGMCLGTASAMTCGGHLKCTGTACLAGCGAAVTGDANCLPAGTYYCDGLSGGACQTLKAAGAACGGDHECSMGLCAGGYCCSSSTPCAMTAATSCGTNGTCAPVTGACEFYPAMSVCAVGNCQGNTLKTLSVCDGVGACQAQADISCPATMCGNNGCTSCAVDADCSAFGYCGGGTCHAKQQAGFSCGATKECLSGVCTASVCN